jgi:hypothetical protein
VYLDNTAKKQFANSQPGHREFSVKISNIVFDQKLQLLATIEIFSAQNLICHVEGQSKLPKQNIANAQKKSVF